MSQKRKLTPKGIEAAIKQLKPGQRLEIMDTEVPGFGLRNRSYILVACYRRGANPTRCTLGKVIPGDENNLAQARKKAQDWRNAILAGKDPREEEAHAYEAAQRAEIAESLKQRHTFAAVAEDFIREKLPRERKGAEVARDIRRDLIPTLGARPIIEIQRIDIRNIIIQKRDRGSLAKAAPAQARNLLGYTKRLFSWAIDQEVYGLESSPCSELKAANLIGDRPVAARVLSDDEIFAFWRAVRRFPYPYREVYQLLLLSALRLNEVADATKSEINYRKQEWTIPAVRMKGKSHKAREHVVPLNAGMLDVLAQMPEFHGQHLFSCNLGQSGVWLNSKFKRALDARMLRTLKALARVRGDNPKNSILAPWVNHDLRRTVRTNLSALKTSSGHRITEEVKEAVLAHAKTGIRGVYDKYLYLDEKREALELWASKLREIVSAPPADASKSNVVPYRSKRA